MNQAVVGHKPEESEFLVAEQAIEALKAEEALLEIDTPAWRSKCYQLAAIEGWLFVAREYGCVNRDIYQALAYEGALFCGRTKA